MLSPMNSKAPEPIAKLDAVSHEQNLKGEEMAVKVLSSTNMDEKDLKNAMKK